jgi:hypothetical protein
MNKCVDIQAAHRKNYINEIVEMQCMSRHDIHSYVWDVVSISHAKSH